MAVCAGFVHGSVLHDDQIIAGHFCQLNPDSVCQTDRFAWIRNGEWGQLGRVANGQALARSWHNSCRVPVVALCVEHRDPGPSRSQRKSQGNRLSASLYPRLARDCPPRRRFVRHDCSGGAGGSAGARSRGHSLPASVSATSFDFHCAPGVSLVRLGVALVVGSQCRCLRHRLLQRLASMPEPARAPGNGVYSCNRIPRFLSPDRRGADLCRCSRLLHADIFSAARPAGLSCGIGPRMFDFQAAIGTGCSPRIRIDRRLENGVSSGSFGSGSTLHRSFLLRNRTLPPLDAHTVECAHRVATARAQALSNPLPANILVHARALAWACPRLLRLERSRRAWTDNRMLDARSGSAPASAIFSDAFRECARGAAPHGLRVSDFGSRVYPAGRLACWSAAHALDSPVGNSSLPGIHAPTHRPFCQMDTYPAFGDCDGGYVVPDLADRSRKQADRRRRDSEHGYKRRSREHHKSLDGGPKRSLLIFQTEMPVLRETASPMPTRGAKRHRRP